MSALHMSEPMAECSAPMAPAISEREDRGEAYFRQYQQRDQLHDALTLLQRADGSWVLDQELAMAVGLRLESLRRLVGELRDLPDPETVVATAAALEFLRSKALDTRHEWRLLAEKAEAWLDAALAGTERVRPEVMYLAGRVLCRENRDC